MFSFGVAPTGGAASISSYGQGGGAVGAPSPKEEFLEFARMTPAQKMRAQILGAMGLTEDDLRAMDDKERLQIEERIKEMIKEQVENDATKKTGVIVDVTA